MRTAGSFFFDTRYQYDQAGRVTEIGHYRDGDATPFTHYQYGYDLADRIATQITSRDTSIAAFANVSALAFEAYAFDKAGQLTGASGVGSPNESFTYDSNGNRVGATAGSSSSASVIDPHNRLKEDAEWTYTYDKEGNLIRKDAKVGTLYWTYEYDHRNRLTRVAHHNSQLPTPVGPIDAVIDDARYVYDAGGKLVQRIEGFFYRGDQVGEIFDDYVNNGAERVLSFDNDGDLHHRYLWGPGRDQLLADRLFSDSAPLNDTYWAATDHLGSVNDLLDTAENLVEHREYNSFGEVDAVFDEYGGALTQPSISDVGYTGKFFDSATGLQNNIGRWYDPSIGRFISEDPIGFGDGPNPFIYGHNNPIIYFDPSGLFIEKPTDNLLRGGLVSIPTQFTDFGLKVGARPLGNLGIDTSFGPTFNLTQTLGRLDGNRLIQGYESQFNNLSRERANLNAQLAEARASLANRSFYEVFDRSNDRARIDSLTTQLSGVVGRQSVARDNLYSAENAILNGDPRQTFSYRSTEYASVGKAFNSGLETGHKAAINGVSSGLVSFGTLGFVDYQGPARVTRQDIYNGYETAFAVSRFTTEFVGGAALGGVASAGKFGRLGTAAFAYDTAGNAVGAGRGLVNAYNNGLTVGNSVQIVGSALGLAGNVATGSRVLGDIASDVSRVRVSFDSTSFSSGGLGGVKLHLNNNNAVGHFGVYDINVNGQLYKIGKADLDRVTQVSGLPTRVHQQIRSLRKVFGQGNVDAGAIIPLGTVTTAQAKIAETMRIQSAVNATGYIPIGNLKSFGTR